MTASTVSSMRSTSHLGPGRHLIQEPLDNGTQRPDIVDFLKIL